MKTSQAIHIFMDYQKVNSGKKNNQKLQDLSEEIQ